MNKIMKFWEWYDDLDKYIIPYRLFVALILMSPIYLPPLLNLSMGWRLSSILIVIVMVWTRMYHQYNKQTKDDDYNI